MKHLALTTVLGIALLPIFTACNSERAKAEQAKQDSIARADSIAKADSIALADSIAKEAKRGVGYTFHPGKKVEGKLIAITFDDGPNHKSTPKNLATLKQYNAVATFFLVGQDAKACPELVKQLAEQGCELANHTWDHPFLSLLSNEEQIANVKKTNDLIKELTGKEVNFYRPPYLDVDSAILTNIAMPAVCGAISGDYQVEKTPEQISSTVLRQASDGAVIILHDFGPNVRTPEALKTIVPELQKRGYKLVTLTDLFTSKGITPLRDRMYHNATSFEPVNPNNTRKARQERSGKKKAS